MRKALAVLLLLSLLATLVVCAGCGEKEAQEEGTAEQIPVEEDIDGVTPKPGEEKGELPPAAAPSEEELGAPIYPGAVFVSGSGEVEIYRSGWVTVAAPRFTTKDAYDDVVAFYTEKLGKPTGTSSTFDDVQTEARWMPIMEEELEIYTAEVVVSREDTEVRIHIVPQADEK